MLITRQDFLMSWKIFRVSTNQFNVQPFYKLEEKFNNKEMGNYL